MKYSYTRDREETFARLIVEGLDAKTIRRIFSLSATIDRLAEAQCNGDWPADNGERKTLLCGHCEGGWAPSTFRKDARLLAREGLHKVCPSCKADSQVYQLIEDVNNARAAAGAAGVFTAILSGDPRGCVVKLGVPSGSTNDWGREGICIPVRAR